MEKLTGKALQAIKLIKPKGFMAIFIALFSLISCVDLKNAIVEDKEIKLIIFSENWKDFLEAIISYNSYDIKIIDNGNYWTMKNIHEEALLEIARIAHLKMEIINNNIANVSVTRTADGGPYIRKYLSITAENSIEITEDTENVQRMVYDPTHPDAIKEGEMSGYVRYPNVDIVNEMTDLIEATRLYEAVIEYSKKKYNYNIIM